MKKLKFIPSNLKTFPYGIDAMHLFDAEGREIKDLVVKNEFAKNNEVSEMTLNISRLSVFDLNGKEQFVKDFQGQNNVGLKGIHTGRFIRSRSVMKLEPGSYSTIRFYLNQKGNSFVYSDKSAESVFRFKYLDFEIENGLKISGKESPQVILRFDFVPFSLQSYFRRFLKIFDQSRSLTSRLSNSLGL